MLTHTIFPALDARDDARERARDGLDHDPDLVPAGEPTWDAMFAELLLAVGDDDLAAVRTLLAIGAPASARNRHGQCPLACAASHGSLDIASLLLDAGADANGLGVNDHPVLTLAAGQGCVGMVELLLAAGADANARRACTGESALHVAAAFGHTDAVMALLRAGADVRARTEAEVETDLFPGRHEVGEETALHRAAENGSRDMIEALLAAGSSRTARTMLGETPQSWARRARRDPEIVRLLKQL